MITEIRQRLARGRVYLRWLLRDVPKNPGYELYARSQGRADRAAFLADRAAGDVAVERNLASFRAVKVPRIIWMYWDKGEAGAPFVVRRCIDSWRHHNPDWDVRVLDANTVQDAADMSDYPAHLPQRFFANLLRLRLLKEHGGVWADATVYCHQPLANWLPLHLTTGFFALRNPGPGRWICSWFLISEPGHVIPTAWEQTYAKLLRGLRRVPDMYFVFFYCLQWRLRNDAESMAAWTRAPSLPAQPSFFMMAALQGQIGPERVQEMLSTGLPVSKLSWKQPITEDAFDAFL